MNRPLDAELHAWADGHLDPLRRREIDAWLATEPETLERLTAWKRQKELLHGAFDPILEEPLPGRLADGASRPRRNPAWRIAAAVGWLTIGIVAGYVLRGTKPAELSAVPPLARNAAIAHVVYVPEVRHPVEVGADQEAHLVQWLSKRLGTPLKTPRFTEQGFDLVGGRLLPGERGPVAQFMYQDANGRRLTLYVKVDADNRDTAFRYA
ncbi:MAG: anti-sigma factor, partial [Chloroflexia bacterium]|nr:anti-sigma factor [Chloroflexia bacterium]